MALSFMFIPSLNRIQVDGTQEFYKSFLHFPTALGILFSGAG